MKQHVFSRAGEMMRLGFRPLQPTTVKVAQNLVTGKLFDLRADELKRLLKVAFQGGMHFLVAIQLIHSGAKLLIVPISATIS